MTAAAIATPRAQTIVQRAYVYIVALVAVHMIVLGVANLLRVVAEIALGAPSGGFTGLPFVFGDVSRPRDLYREQASLAIALLVVGTPAWWWHFRLAGRAARLTEERASALRALYVYVVIFVTALLLFGYGQRALRLVLQGMTVGTSGLFVEPEWPARAAGAAAMAVTAAAVLAFHLRLASADRRAVALTSRAAFVRDLALYGLVVIGFLFASFQASQLLTDIGRRVADGLAPLQMPEPPRVPFAPGPPPRPSLDDELRFGIFETLPGGLAGALLWLVTWTALARDAGAGVLRKLAIYLMVFVSVVVVLVSATTLLSQVGRRVLGDPLEEPFANLWHDIPPSIAALVVFVPMWLFHRAVVEREAAREAEVARAATIRRSYTYLISATGLAMAAIGVAGTLGVIGSAVLGLNTHSNQETATYVALALVGGAAWAFHWRTARARLDDDERRSLPRRLYLYAAILGGVLGLLVFGSAVLYRVLNGALALSFSVTTWHDIWHFAVDSAVSGIVAWSAFRALRADRAVLGTAAEDVFEVRVLVRATDRDAARARVTAALGDSPDVRLKP